MSTSEPTGGLSENAAEMARRPRGGARRERQARRRHRITVVVAVLAIVGGIGIAVHIGAFYLRSKSTGAALTRQLHREARKVATGQATCAPLSDTATGPEALVVASSIGLNAPVEAGDSDAVLNVAVAHVPGSAWPSDPGTTLLAAHDVSYFSQIDRLTTGQTVEVTTPCATYVYSVSGHQIVPTGSPLYSSPSQNLLVLETCYPLNALFITSQRYLVTAVLQRTRLHGTPLPTAPPPLSAPSVPAPPVLAAQGLTLDDNEVQLGTLGLVGTPSASWQQSPQPLEDEAASLADYFAALRSAEQGQTSWWTDLSPAVPFSATEPLQSSRFSYIGSLTPTLDVTGDIFTGAQIDVDVDIGGERYALHVSESVDADSLLITEWTLSRQT
jgi:sortase A